MLGAGDVKPNLSPATTMFFVAETVLDPLNADAIIEAVPPVEPLLSCTSTTPLELVVRVEADRVEADRVDQVKKGGVEQLESIASEFDSLGVNEGTTTL